MDVQQRPRPRPRYSQRTSNQRMQRSRIRLIGWLLFLCPIIALIGWSYAQLNYTGVYSIRSNRVGDLGARACGILLEEIGPRAVCSPGSFLFNGALITAGLFMVTAASTAEQLRFSFTVLHPLLDARITRLIGGWGVALGFAGLAPLDLVSVVHEIALVSGYLFAWSTLIATVIVMIGARAPHGLDVWGWALIISTALMAFLSIVSACMFLVSVRVASGGIFQLISFAVLGAWLHLYGITMVITGRPRHYNAHP